MSRVCRLFPARKSLVALSRTRTRAPARRAVIAAHIAALPPPITRTSTGLIGSAMANNEMLFLHAVIAQMPDEFPGISIGAAQSKDARDRSGAETRTAFDGRRTRR